MVDIGTHHRRHATSAQIGFDPANGVYHNQHDWSGSESLSFTVLRTIAICTGTTPESGTPLSTVVDTDALDRLFCTHPDRTTVTDHVTFAHEGCLITVYRNGHLVVRDQNPRQ